MADMFKKYNIHICQYCLLILFLFDFKPGMRIPFYVSLFVMLRNESTKANRLETIHIHKNA